ncbi:hypothetical protein CDAR_112491 [Caerostris darwini]|uniref:Uncharacterized protein n=1 Tax=Caerostris darwini TaxID=1538125 RepID=A0AAV4Q2L0_9ARAC|nr:hypothetical protein CDAR_112491 [Caerostris darwini]
MVEVLNQSSHSNSMTNSILKFLVQISPISILRISTALPNRGKFSNQSPPPFQKRKEPDIAVLFRFTPPSTSPATQIPERNKDNETLSPILLTQDGGRTEVTVKQTSWTTPPVGSAIV